MWGSSLKTYVFHFNVDVNKRRITVCNGSVIIFTVQERFCARSKISVSDVFLEAEFTYISRISLSPTPFAPG